MRRLPIGRLPIGRLLLAAMLVLSAGTAAAGPNQITIGVLGDMAGSTADIGGPGSVIAAQMAVADHGGQAAGRPVRLVSADMQNRPDIGSAIARRWFEQDGVDAITDLPQSAVALAVQQVAREQGRVLLVTGAATTELTGAQCAPYTIHWADDTSALAQGTARAVIEEGGRSWYFVTADFAFGHAMERDAQAVIAAQGGRVVGSVRHPMNAPDFSSFLLGAQASGADVVALANIGADLTTAVKQAAEFGFASGRQRLAGFVVAISDVHALGLRAAQGLLVTEGFYWDRNDESRTWSHRFFERLGKMPTREQAATYAAVRHYLKAIDAAGTDEPAAVTARMKALPADYFGATGGIRPDGRVLYDLALYQVKAPAGQRYDWDYYAERRRIPAAEAYKPMGGCPFLK